MNKHTNKVKSSGSAFSMMPSNKGDYSKLLPKSNRTIKITEKNEEVISEEELLQFWWRY